MNRQPGFGCAFFDDAYSMNLSKELFNFNHLLLVDLDWNYFVSFALIICPLITVLHSVCFDVNLHGCIFMWNGFWTIPWDGYLIENIKFEFEFDYGPIWYVY